jgi:hypothetical protein
MIITILLSLAGIGLMLWLLFTFAVYALPFYAGITATVLVYKHDAGWLGAGFVGLLSGAAVLLLGQFLFATLRSPTARATVAVTYAVPAGLAGYHAVHGLSAIGGMSEPWRIAFSILGAVMVGSVAWTRVSALYAGGPERGVAGSRPLPARTGPA